MKNFNLLQKWTIIFVWLGLASISAFAQETAEDPVTDEELQKYAVAMDSIDRMKQAVIEEMSEMVKGNENITGARYNELNDAIGDEAKLKELAATEEEIAFVKSVLARKDEMTAEIQKTFVSLAKDYIGGKTYNKVKAALAKDAALKEKYNNLLAEMKPKEDVTEQAGN